MVWLKFIRYKPLSCKKKRKIHTATAMNGIVSLSLVLLFLFYPLLFPSTCLSNELNHHVIVLIDRSASMVKPDKSKAIENLSNLLGAELAGLCFKEGAVLRGRKLLDQSKGDRLSAVSFGLGKICPDFREFIKPIVYDASREYRYVQTFNKETYLFSRLWDAIGGNEKERVHFFGAHWSAISMAIPAAVYHHREPGGNLSFNRTFILMVTDDEYNSKSGDPTHEFHYISRLNDAFDDRKMCFRSMDVARERYGAVQSRYLWKELEGASPKKFGKYYLRIFELFPITRNFAVESVARFEDNEVVFKPKGDFYQGFVTLNPQFFLGDIGKKSQKFTDEFTLARAEITIVDRSGSMVDKQSSKTLSPVKYSTPIRIACEKGVLGEEVSENSGPTDYFLRIKFWTRWNENVYGVQELHPDGGIEQGKFGLNRFIPITVVAKEPAPDIEPVPLRRVSPGETSGSIAYAADAYEGGADNLDRVHDGHNSRILVAYASPDDQAEYTEYEVKDGGLKRIFLILAFCAAALVTVLVIVSLFVWRNGMTISVNLNQSNFSHKARK